MALESIINEIRPLTRNRSITKLYEQYCKDRGTDKDLNNLYEGLGVLCTLSPDFPEGDKDILKGVPDSGVTGLVNDTKASLKEVVGKAVKDHGKEILAEYAKAANTFIKKSSEEKNKELSKKKDLSKETKQAIINEYIYSLVGEIVLSLPKDEKYDNKLVNKAIQEINAYKEVVESKDTNAMKDIAAKAMNLPAYAAGFTSMNKYANPGFIQERILPLKARTLGSQFVKDGKLNEKELAKYVGKNVEAYGEMLLALKEA